MKIIELVTEAIVATATSGKYTIKVKGHLFDRADERKVPLTTVTQILDKLPQLSDQIDEIPPGPEFWVKDYTLNASLGFKKGMNDLLYLGTTMYGTKIVTGPHHIILKIT